MKKIIENCIKTIKDPGSPGPPFDHTKNKDNEIIIPKTAKLS